MKNDGGLSPMGGRDSPLLRVIGFVIALVAVTGFVRIVLKENASDHRATFDSMRPLELKGEEYVSSDACASCHPHEYGTWSESYHRTMTQLPDRESVVGRFDGKEVEFLGTTIRPFRRGDEFWVDLPNRQWEEGSDEPRRVEKPVLLTTGSHHQQLYWLPGKSPRSLVLMPLVYLTEDQEWTPRQAKFLKPPISHLGFDRVRWNESCIQCHSVHGRPRPQKGMGAFDTHVAEFGIACEACHGPAENHVETNRDPWRRYARYFDDSGDETIVNPKELTADRSSQICAQCHGLSESYAPPNPKFYEWLENGFDFRPGEDLSEHRVFADLRTRIGEPRWEAGDVGEASGLGMFVWLDGMIRIRGREYTAIAESPCFRGGEYGCLSCHTMHQPEDDPRSREEWANGQLKLGMDGDRACLQCHPSFETEQALVEHTYHEADSPGSRCQNCHMPYTAYGLLKSTRSHEIDSPNVRTSTEVGRPDACSLCHLDRPLAWSAQHLHERYGIPEPELNDDQSDVSAGVQWALAGDAGQRALIAWAMGWGPARQASGDSWMPPYLAALMFDPYDAIRYIAKKSLSKYPEFEGLSYDIFAPREDRRAIVDSLVRHWTTASPRSERPTSEAILFNANGEIDNRAFHQLLSRRDNRPVTLAE
ncbi:C cytochrome precursor [Myxococcota bacterium]|nr:C cytochrome precursor [Myxococcota bacterium]